MLGTETARRCGSTPSPASPGWEVTHIENTTHKKDFVYRRTGSRHGKEDVLIMLFPIEGEPHPMRPYRNQGLFSEHYLETRLRESPEWQEDPEPLRQRLLELYRSKEGLLKGANEAQTENEFIQPVLEALGFAYWVQATTKGGPGRFGQTTSSTPTRPPKRTL